MKVWAFDENRADFVDAAPERMNADATGYYIIRRGDDVLVREHGQERPMPERLTVAGTVAKLAMRQPFVLFKGLTFQKLCLPGAFRPGDHHNKMLRPGLCVVHASPQYL